MWAKQKGFTIVELLIVIVVIAILAAITIVAYNGIQARARASEVTSALNQVKKKLELYKIDNGSYPTTGNLASAGVNDSDVNYQYTSDGSVFCITGTASTVSYKASNTTGPVSGGCDGHGQGGVAAVTNLIANPSFESNTTGLSYSSGGGSVSVTRPTTGGLKGNAYTRLMWTAAASTEISAYECVSATPGKVYKGIVNARPSWAGALMRLQLQYSISTGGYVWNASNANAAATQNAWNERTYSSTAPANATNVCMQVSFINGIKPAVNDTLDVDGFMLTADAADSAYADGDSPSWVWNSTQNNSTSTGPAI